MEPTGWAFRLGAAVRHRRFFHPNGVLATGLLDRVAPVSVGLPVPSCTVVARISKAAGTPGALPDAVGLALRVPAPDGGRWDILLVSAGSGVIGRALGLRPVVSWSGVTMTTLMPLRHQGGLWWLRARLSTVIGGHGLALSAIANRIAGDQLCFELDQARGTAEFRPLARLVLNRLDTVGGADHDVSFDPTANTAPGVQLRPTWLAELRALAYRGSRKGRGAPQAIRSADRPHGG